MKRKNRNIAGIIIIAAVLMFLITTSIVKSYKYYYTVDEALGKYNVLMGKDIKIAGDVKKGSISSKGVESGVYFTIVGNESELSVNYNGQVPDTFKEEIPVVLEGRLGENSSFTADSLLTKCASRYESKLEP